MSKLLIEYNMKRIMLHIGGFFLANLIVLLIACFIAGNFDVVSMWKESSEGDRFAYLFYTIAVTAYFSFTIETDNIL